MCCVATLSCWLQPTDPCTTPLDISQLLSFSPSNIPTFPPSLLPPVSPRLWDISGPSLEVGVCLAGRAEGCELLWCCVMCNGLPEMDTLTLYTCHSLPLSPLSHLNIFYSNNYNYSPMISLLQDRYWSWANRNPHQPHLVDLLKISGKDEETLLGSHMEVMAWQQPGLAFLQSVHWISPETGGIINKSI